MYYIVLNYSLLHCTTLYYIVLHCITLYYIVLHCITLYYIVLHCIILYYIVLHCIALYDMDGWMDGWLDGCMHAWIDAWMDAWMDGSSHGTYAYACAWLMYASNVQYPCDCANTRCRSYTYNHTIQTSDVTHNRYTKIDTHRYECARVRYMYNM